MGKRHEKRCGTCKHWDARTDKNGRRINRAEICRRCVYPEIEWPDMPECQSLQTWRMSMMATDGTNCPVWEKANG